jgi:hypothetical protein
MTHNIHIEVTFKGKACLACVYMEQALLDVLPGYGQRIVYHRIDIFSDLGKKRFLALSCALFGNAGVYRHHRLAPIPGLFIDGQLAFDAIPSRDELKAAIEERLTNRGVRGTNYDRQERSRHAEKSTR